MPRGHSKTTPRAVHAAQRRSQAVKMRIAGDAFEDIGQALGMSEIGAWKTVNEAVKAYNNEAKTDVRELVEIESRRLTRYLRKLEPAIETGDVRAIDSAVRISARLSTLHGLDGAQKVELTGKDGGPVQVDSFRDRLIAQIEAFAAKREGRE